MTNEQTKAFILTAAKVRQIKRQEAQMKARIAKSRRENRWRFRCEFRLFRYRYVVALHLTGNYAGGYAFNLHFRPGENWLRGNDLRDGKLLRLPWVLWDILCYEFGIGRWRWPIAMQAINRDPTEYRPSPIREIQAPQQQWPPAEQLHARPVIPGVNERTYPPATEEQPIIPFHDGVSIHAQPWPLVEGIEH